MRIVFAGTPDIAVTVLEALLASPHEVVGVLSQPDRPSGRGRQLQASPVKRLAVDHHIPVWTPERLDDADVLSEIAALAPDLMVVVAYGLIVPSTVLSMPRLGCWNVHVSLLPRWRGAAPIARAIAAGDAVTGVSIMQMDAGLDTGPIIDQVTLPILPTDTTDTLTDRLAEAGAACLLQCIQLAQSGSVSVEVQSTEGVTYAKKLTKAEAQIDWLQPAEVLSRHIRAMQPWPVAYFICGDQRVRVFEALAEAASTAETPGTVVRCDDVGIQVATASGYLLIQRCQLPGGKSLPVAALRNGKRFPVSVGDVLT